MNRITDNEENFRTYHWADCVVFRKTKETYGGLSNMASGYPINIDGCRILTSEALYQACRFPHMPDVQRLIIGQRSPMTAKMKSKPYRKDGRRDWDSVRVPIMRWCLRVKLIQNWDRFSRLLLETGQRLIVEESRKDDFWGAKPKDTDILEGQNVLGRLLMELREKLRSNPNSLHSIAPAPICDFLLFGKPVPVIHRPGAEAHPTLTETDICTFGLGPPDLFDTPTQARVRTEHTIEGPTRNQQRKKLIEVALPLEAINAASANEKMPGIGPHPRGVHLWWARRPLAACRAVLFCQLVDDPSSWPDRFPTEQAQDEERDRLFELIEQLVKWKNSTNEYVLNAARFEIARSIAWNRGEEPPAKANPTNVLAYLQEHAPPVYDPFCGGGSILLEAQRLGLRAFGSDLNPVAVLISKALVEIPPKFAGLPPINPARDPHKRWKDAQGLAEDVRHYGQWMRDEAEKRIGHLYPKVEVAEQAVREQPSLEPLKGQKLTVIAWLWARTVATPNPAAKGAHVPLVSSFMLSTKESKKAWVEPVIDASAPDGYRFVVRSGRIAKEDESKAKLGTKAGKAQDFLCTLTGTPIPRSYIQKEGKSDRLSERLMAIVAKGRRGRVYLSPGRDHEQIAVSAASSVAVDEARASFLSGSTPTRAMITGGVCSAYGLRTWGHLFTPRQLVALTTFSDLVSEAREKVLADARAAGLAQGPRLADGGTGAEAYADAVATYLGCVVDRSVDFNSSLVRWNPSNEKVMNTYARQALPMTWDFGEAGILSDVVGGFQPSCEFISKCILTAPANGSGEIEQIDATSNSYPVRPAVISTDPPYYNNICSAELSDFFYVWLRRSLRAVWPGIFATLLVPKADELVATPYRHGGREKAERFFEEGMGRALKAMERAVDPSVPLTIYYAFKQSEIAQEGIASTGWATFLQAIANAGFAIDGTWPIRTEQSARIISHGTNALASSIVLACRKRPENVSITTRAEFLKTLKRALPEALKLLQHGSIAPVDMAQASIGPGMAIFTRYAKVLEADDSPMTVKTALQLINAALDEFLSEQEAEYDPHTRFAITWFETHGMDPGPYGTAETLATARGVAVTGVAEAGILEARGGKVRLLRREEMPEDWDPATDPRLTVWECTQYLIRALRNEGESATGELLAHLGARGEVARDLAYRLYGICERKKWAEEGIAYNGLVVAWPEISKLAAQAGPAGPAEPELAL